MFYKKLQNDTIALFQFISIELNNRQASWWVMNWLLMVEWQGLKLSKRWGMICIASAQILVYSYLEPN
jgi:hypothetical protein